MVSINNQIHFNRGGVEDTRLEAKAKDTKKSEAKVKDRHSRGQGQGHKRKCSPKKKGFHKNFSGDLHKILTIQKIVLFSSRGQANFWGLQAKAKDFKMCPLHLCILSSIIWYEQLNILSIKSIKNFVFYTNNKANSFFNTDF